jgi:hypothetical protein
MCLHLFKVKTKGFLLIIFAAPAFIYLPLSYAQISGKVMEKGTRKPLAEVNVFILPQKWKATTDSNGHFSFPEDISEDSELVINVTGYLKYSQPLSKNLSSSPEKIGLQLYVEKETYQYFETTVTGLRENKDSQKTLTQDEFLTMPGSGGDPVKAVQNLPGVNRATGGDSRVIVQGSEPEDTRYNLLGHEVPLVFHFGGLSSIVTPEAIDSVDYYSAGYATDLGRALGGHVGLQIRAPRTDRQHAFAFLDAFTSGGLVEGPIDENSSYLVTGRYSYIGEVLKGVMKDNKDFNLVVAPTFYDLSLLYQRKLNDENQVRIFAILSNDKLEFVLSKPIGNDPKLRGSFYQQTQFYRIIPEWTHKIDDTANLKLAIGYGNNDILADIGTNYFHLTNKALTPRIEYKKTVNNQWKATLGVDATDDWYKVALKIPASFSEGGVNNPISSGELKETEVNGRNTLTGIYWMNELKTEENSPWSYLPQLRVDRFSPTKETLTQPRLSVRYQFDESLLLRASSGIYYQLPLPQQYDEYWGNPNLKSLQATHYSMGFEKDFRNGASNGYTWSTTLFYKKLDRLVLASAEQVVRDGVQVFENFNNKGTGSIKGFETQVKYKDQADISWTGSYTYLQSHRKKPGESELPSQYDQTHSFNLLVSVPHNNWLFGTRVRFVSGNPYTPIVGATLDVDNDVYIPKRGVIFSERNPNFFQADLRIDRKWIYDTWILSAYLDVENISNSKNQEGLVYSYDYSEKEAITGLPILPSIGVKGEF